MRKHLIALIAFMLIFTNAQVAYSLSSYQNATKNGKCNTEGSTTKISGKNYTCTFVNEKKGLRWKVKKWVPAGFTRWDKKVAYKWLEAGEYSCSYYGSRCWGMLLVVKNSCNVYAELSLYDSAGYTVGFTNEAFRIGKGETARFIFDTFDDRVTSGRLTEINCY